MEEPTKSSEELAGFSTQTKHRVTIPKEHLEAARFIQEFWGLSNIQEAYKHAFGFFAKHVVPILPQLGHLPKERVNSAASTIVLNQPATQGHIRPNVAAPRLEQPPETKNSKADFFRSLGKR